MSKRLQYMLFALRLLFGLGVLGMAFAIVDFGLVLEAIKSIDPTMFALAVLVTFVGTIVVPAIITSRTLRVGDIRLGMWELVKINFIMRFYVLILPHALTVAIRWHRYRQGQQGKGWQVAAMLLFERAVQFVAIVAFAFVFLLVSQGHLPTALHFLVPLSGLLTLLGIGLLLMFLSRKFFLLAGPWADFTAGHAPQVIARHVDRFTAAVADYQKIGNRHVAFILGWAMAWHGLFVLSAYIVSMGLGVEISFSDIGWMRSAVFLLTVLPITVGGIGVREAGFAVLLHLYGADEAVALALPLVLLAIQLILGLTGAALESARVVSGIRGNANAKG